MSDSVVADEMRILSDRLADAPAADDDDLYACPASIGEDLIRRFLRAIWGRNASGRTNNIDLAFDSR
jgi:hypothetical protein